MNSAPAHSIRLLTYNIHKGFDFLNRRFMLNQIKASIRSTGADLVCLQEVQGDHRDPSRQLQAWNTNAQFEFLADQTWSHYSYGKNAIYTEGHHGNAILSKYPILESENEDVSPHRFEKRGLLHAQIPLPGLAHPLHVFCVHLALFERHRFQQVLKLAQRISKMVPSGAPLMIAGDFNDWTQKLSARLKADLELDEAFVQQHGHHARTFPSSFPFMTLDRIYFRNLRCTSAETLSGPDWRQLSDHLPLLATFDYSGHHP